MTPSNAPRLLNKDQVCREPLTEALLTPQEVPREHTGTQTLPQGQEPWQEGGHPQPSAGQTPPQRAKKEAL